MGRALFADRARIFLRFHDLLLERQDEVLDLIQLETGKARRHAFEEVLDTAVVCRYYARHAKKLLGRAGARGAPAAHPDVGVRVPVGVVGCIVAVELSAEPGDHGCGAGADGRQHGGAQARSQTTLHRALGGRRCCARRAFQPDVLRRGHGRRAARSGRMLGSASITSCSPAARAPGKMVARRRRTG